MPHAPSPAAAPVQESHVAIMFSGGTDSTLAAARMLDRYDQVTLVTCDPGYLFFMDNVKVHARALEDRFGRRRVRHVILPMKHVADKILFGEVSRDLARYAFHMASLVCLGCRLSMHAAALAFCLEERIPFIADGSVAIQNAIPEQMATTLSRNRRFYFERFGIWHQSPIYDEAASDRELEALGIARQTGLKKQFILFDTQYTCPFGVPADVFARLFYKPLMGDQRERESAEYQARKFPKLSEHIDDHFDERGQSMQDIVAQLHDFHRRNDTLAKAGAGADMADAPEAEVPA